MPEGYWSASCTVGGWLVTVGYAVDDLVPAECWPHRVDRQGYHQLSWLGFFCQANWRG